MPRKTTKTTRKTPRKTASGPARRRKSASSSRRAKSRRTPRRGYLLAGFLLLAALFVWAALGISSAGRAAVASLEGEALLSPVEVFAAPRLLRPGHRLDLKSVFHELQSIGYLQVDHPPRTPGEIRQEGDGFQIYRRAHAGPLGPVPALFVRGVVSGAKLASLHDDADRALSVFSCEPVRLGAYQGELLQERAPLTLEEFSPRLIDAVLAAEDSRFLTHRGLDPRGIVRAAWADLRRRKMVQGGSTITQQVIKNRVVGSELTLFRKLREAVLSLYVERAVSKQRLLTIYLNEVYLGQRGPVSVIGLPAAARHYFGKNLSDIGLGEQALLAGMIASPGRFDPFKKPEQALARRAWVLSRMETTGAIDQAERDAAAARPLELAGESAALDPAGDVLDSVYRELSRRGWEPQPAAQPAKVFTSIDPRLQQVSRQALESTLAALERDRPSRRPLEGAVVILRPATGEVAAVVGGRHGTRGGFNRALEARRQPGSAFKPFVALAAFSRLDHAPSSPVEDAPLSLDLPSGRWAPRNYDGRFRGTVTVRQALEMSLNVPMVRVGMEVGPDAIAAVAREVGFEGVLPKTPSLALGSGEVTPLEMARAYSTLVGLGTRRPATMVRGLDRSGVEGDATFATLLPEQQVVDPADAWLVLDSLKGVLTTGTGRSLASTLQGRGVAGKTGTSQDGRDAWFVLTTGSSVIVVWIGRDDAQAAGLTGSRAALPVVRRILQNAGDLLLEPLPQPPDGIRRLRIDPDKGCVLRSSSGKGVEEVFRRGTEPGRCSGLREALGRLFGKKQEQDPGED